MKHTFLSIAFLSASTFFMASCDSSSTSGEGSEDSTVAVDESTEQITESEETEPADLMYYAFMNNYMQTTLGSVAEQKGSSEKVKSLGTEIVEQNKQIMAQIEDLASAAKIQLPSGLEVEDQEKLDSLGQLSGAEFDKAYVKMVMEQKNKTIDLMEDLATSANNPIVNGLVDDIITTEREQIERAEIVQQEMM